MILILILKQKHFFTTYLKVRFATISKLNGTENNEVIYTFNEDKELNCIKVEVKDSGIGIGVFLVKSLVDAIGGKVEVESEVNNSSKFTIMLSF